MIAEPLGSAGAIRKIQNHSGFFDQTFIVICGDAVIDLDIRELLRAHREKGALATIALREVSDDEVHNYGVVVQDADGRITEFQEKPSLADAKSRMINTGIYIFEPEILLCIPKDGAYDIGSELFPLLAQQGGLFGVTLSSPWQWLDIGKVPDFHDVTMKAMRGEIDGFCVPGREVRPGVWVGMNVNVDLDRCHVVPPVFIGGSATVHAGATLIGPIVIGANAVVDAGAHLEHSVVMEYTRVGKGAFFNSKIIGQSFCASADGTVLDGRHTDTAWLFGDARSRESARNDEQAGIMELASHQQA